MTAQTMLPSCKVDAVFVGALAMLAAAPGLSPEWVRKLRDRSERLSGLSGGEA